MIGTRLSAYEVLAELSQGQDFSDDVFNGLVEFNAYTKDMSWMLYSQLRHSQVDRASGDDDAMSVALGFKFEPDNRWSASAEFIHDLEAFDARSRRNLLKAQLRYRFQ